MLQLRQQLKYPSAVTASKKAASSAMEVIWQGKAALPKDTPAAH